MEAQEKFLHAQRIGTPLGHHNQEIPPEFGWGAPHTVIVVRQRDFDEGGVRLADVKGREPIGPIEGVGRVRQLPVDRVVFPTAQRAWQGQSTSGAQQTVMPPKK